MSPYVRSRRAAGGDAEAPCHEGDDDDDRAGSRSGHLHIWIALAVASGIACYFAVRFVPRAGQFDTLPLDENVVPKPQHVQALVEKESDDSLQPQLPEMHKRPLQQEHGLPSGPENRGTEPQLADKNATHVHCTTTAGPINIAVHWNWAPHGAARFLDMVNSGFFSTKVGLFRAVKGFLCQTGIAGDPEVHRAWVAKGQIPDDTQWLDPADPRRMKRGYVSFAGGGPNSRGVEFFFAFRDLGLGESPWEVPFGTLKGATSFHTMDRWYTGYGDLQAFGGHAPDQHRMYRDGRKYLEENFHELDYITGCSVKHHQHHR